LDNLKRHNSPYKISKETNYYIKRKAFIKWRRNNNIFNGPFNKKHIKSSDDHCFTYACNDDNNLLGNIICLNCNCDKMKNTLKKIIIKQKFLKELNPIKYYLYLWHKNVLLKK